jgi:hypothetical protein
MKMADKEKLREINHIFGWKAIYFSVLLLGIVDVGELILTSNIDRS